MNQSSYPDDSFERGGYDANSKVASSHLPFFRIYHQEPQASVQAGATKPGGQSMYNPNMRQPYQGGYQPQQGPYQGAGNQSPMYNPNMRQNPYVNFI